MYKISRAIVRYFGKPDLLLVFIFNHKWNEITENHLAGQTSHDQPDLVARVFDIKKKAMLKDLKMQGILEHTVTDFDFNEFQTRPQMHILISLVKEAKIRIQRLLTKWNVQNPLLSF